MTAAVKSKTTRSEAAEALEVATREIVERGNVRRAGIEKAIAAINELLANSEKSLDDVADRLFSTAWGADFNAALAPDIKQSRSMLDLLDAADDGSLKLDASSVRKAVRVGAINKRLTGTLWSGLSFTAKVTLLPLLADSQDFMALQEGARFAAHSGTSTRLLRDWVAQRSGGATHSPKVARAPTAMANAKALEVGGLLSADAQRDAWVSRFMQLSAAERRQQLEQVKVAALNFDALAKCLDLAMAALSG